MKRCSLDCKVLPTTSWPWLAVIRTPPGERCRCYAQAVDGFDSAFASAFAEPQAKCLPDLAAAHAIAGDADTAVIIGHQAIDAVTALHSPRAYDRLHVLNTALEPLHTSAGVAELRDRLTITAT
jgi:hypothetical protein